MPNLMPAAFISLFVKRLKWLQLQHWSGN